MAEKPRLVIVAEFGAVDVATKMNIVESAAIIDVGDVVISFDDDKSVIVRVEILNIII